MKDEIMGVVADKTRLSPEQIVLNKCLALKKSESCLIVADQNKISIAQKFFSVAGKITTKTTLLLTNANIYDGQEPNRYVSAEMKLYDVILLVTTKSLTHTSARRNATKKGARIASMPDITDDMIKRCIDVDYSRMSQLGKKIAIKLSKTQKIRLTSNNGTDLSFSISGVEIEVSDGIFSKKGRYGNLPDGEVCMMPVVGSANGRLVIDGSILNLLVDKPVIIDIRDGYARNISGGKVASLLADVLLEHGKDAFNVAEFGIGINPKARITGNVLEDEKAVGTVHIAFGNNMSFGGSVDVPVHIDGIVKNPVAYADGSVFLENRMFLL
ncbi:MAG: aminopeptidase [Candidatus Woesearchaeota archaeon]